MKGFEDGPEYEGIDCGPVFLKDGTVEYMAHRDGGLYRVDLRP